MRNLILCLCVSLVAVGCVEPAEVTVDGEEQIEVSTDVADLLGDPTVNLPAGSWCDGAYACRWQCWSDGSCQLWCTLSAECQCTGSGGWWTRCGAHMCCVPSS